MSPPQATTSPEQIDALDRLLRLSPHNEFLGMHLESVIDGKLTCDIEIRDEFIGNPEDGLLHGGVVTAMLDASCGLAVMVKLGRLTRIATLDLRIDYLKPATAQNKLYCRCSCYKLTQQIAFVEGMAFTVREDGTEDDVAKATGTFMVIKSRGGF